MKTTWVMVLAATVGLAVSCGGPGQAALKVTALPPAEVTLDGAVVGTTPLELTVAPGAHALVFRAEGFRDHEVTIEAAAGQTVEAEALLVVADPDDEAALAVLAAALDVERDPLGADVEVHRGAGRSGVVLYWPQGEVRLASLMTYRVDVDEDYEDDGFLVFRKGGKEIHREEFVPEETVTVAEIPGVVREAIKANSVVTWGVVYDRNKRRDATCQFKAIRGDRVDSSLVKLEKSRNFQRQPEVVQEIMRADVLRNKQLHSEALVHYLAIAQQWPDSTLPFKGIAASAQRLDLTDTPLFAEAARFSAGKGRGPGGGDSSGSFTARTGLPLSLKGPSLDEVHGVSPDAASSPEEVGKIDLPERLAAAISALSTQAEAVAAEVEATEDAGAAQGLRLRQEALMKAKAALERASADGLPPGDGRRDLAEILAGAVEAIDGAAAEQEGEAAEEAGEAAAAVLAVLEVVDPERD